MEEEEEEGRTVRGTALSLSKEEEERRILLSVDSESAPGENVCCVSSSKKR